jgi:hypothetical protein
MLTAEQARELACRHLLTYPLILILILILYVLSCFSGFPKEMCFVVSTNFTSSQANQWYNLQGRCWSIERATVILCNDLR